MQIFLLTILLFIVPAQASEHAQEAAYLKKSYLNNNHYIENLPMPLKGRAMDISKSLVSNFSTHSSPSITGVVEIGELEGGFRLNLTRQENALYFNKRLRVEANVTIGSGLLHIYSPVDIDFWKMATLFIDRPEKKKDNLNAWQLKGFILNEIVPGSDVQTSVNLLSIGGDYLMLMGTASDEVKDIHIELTATSAPMP